MDKAILATRAQQFEALHHDTTFLLPNAWDPMSARILEAEGFPAIATTSGGLSWALGWPDGERAPWSEVVAATRRIATTLHTPLSADIETGYAATAAEVRSNVVEIIEAGAVGVNIEDQQGGKLRGIEDACARIRAAREAGEEARIPLLINARTDVFHLGPVSEAAVEEALRRAEAYLKAGASCIFLFGLSDLATLSRLTKEIGAPVNVVGRPGGPPLEALAEAGVKRVSIAAGLALLAYGAASEAAARLRATGEFESLRTRFTRAEAQKLASVGQT